MPRFDEPTAIDTDRRQERLVVLGGHLAQTGFVIELRPGKLVVRHPEHRELADTITCRPREDDDGRLWYFTSWQERITDANLPMEAVTQIKNYLVRRQ